MTNNQAEAYGLLALNAALCQRGYDEQKRRDLLNAFYREIKSYFDFWSEEEAEEKVREIIR